MNPIEQPEIQEAQNKEEIFEVDSYTQLIKDIEALKALDTDIYWEHAETPLFTYADLMMGQEMADRLFIENPSMETFYNIQLFSIFKNGPEETIIKNRIAKVSELSGEDKSLRDSMIFISTKIKNLLDGKFTKTDLNIASTIASYLGNQIINSKHRNITTAQKTSIYKFINETFKLEPTILDAEGAFEKVSRVFRS